MVIHLTKELLEYIKNTENENYITLLMTLKNNLDQNILCKMSYQNFIYLDYDTCLFLKKDLKDSQGLENYFGKVMIILSVVDNLQKIKIILPNQIAKKNEINYSNVEEIQKLINKIPYCIVENINDENIYEKIFSAFEKNKNNLNTKIEFISGNGGQMDLTFEKYLKRNLCAVAITDHDKKYEGYQNKTSTSYKVKKIINKNLFPGEHIELKYKNIEGLIPYRLVKENLNGKEITQFNYLYQCQKDKKWLYYFDFKDGIKKNIIRKEKKKDGTSIEIIVREPLAWWNNQFNNIKIEDIYYKLSDHEILKNGIAEIKNFTEEDILTKSSKEQRNEYERIYNLIYPWMIVNNYEKT